MGRVRWGCRARGRVVGLGCPAPTQHRGALAGGAVCHAGAVQSAKGGSPLLATVSLVAMAVLVTAWWRLRDAQVPVRWWWTTTALWFGPLVAAMPLYSRDLYSYTAQGLLWDQGLSPYDHVVRELDSPWRTSTAPTWLDSTTPYGPVWLLLARAVASVSDFESDTMACL